MATHNLKVSHRTFNVLNESTFFQAENGLLKKSLSSKCMEQESVEQKLMDANRKIKSICKNFNIAFQPFNFVGFLIIFFVTLVRIWSDLKIIYYGCPSIDT